jgi:hypothetical protein
MLKRQRPEEDLVFLGLWAEVLVGLGSLVEAPLEDVHRGAVAQNQVIDEKGAFLAVEKAQEVKVYQGESPAFPTTDAVKGCYQKINRVIHPKKLGPPSTRIAINNLPQSSITIIMEEALEVWAGECVQ